VTTLSRINAGCNALAGRIDRRFHRLLTALFYAGFLTELVIVIIDKSALVNPYEGQLYRLTFLCFLFKLLSERFTLRERGYLLFFLVLSCVSYLASGRNELLRCTVFAAAMVRMDVKHLMKCMLAVTAAGCLVLNVLSLTGVLGTVFLTADYGSGVETRLCLGLGHPNSLHCMAAVLVLLFLYLYHDRLLPWAYALLFAGNGVLLYFTRSQMGALAMAGGTLLQAAMDHLKKDTAKDALCRCMELLLALGLVFSLLAAIFNPSYHPWMQRLDSLMTGRVGSLWDTTFHEGTLSSWRWFSDRNSDRFFDLGWVRLVYWYGVIPAVVILDFLFRWLRFLRRNRQTAAFVMLSVLSVYTVFEAHLVSEYLGRNVLLLLAALYVPMAAGESR
jgi:hypothetical protein